MHRKLVLVLLLSTSCMASVPHHPFTTELPTLFGCKLAAEHHTEPLAAGASICVVLSRLGTPNNVSVVQVPEGDVLALSYLGYGTVVVQNAIVRRIFLSP